MTSTTEFPAAGECLRRAQIGTVESILRDGGCTVLSLDVFDTLLWRRVPRPTDAFVLLASDLRESGDLPEWITAAAFRRMRIGAEERARNRRESADPPVDRPAREVSLVDIWSEMPVAVFPEAERMRMVAAEVALERRVTVVDRDVARLAALARERGIGLCLVSDTYLAGEHLEFLLDRPELAALGDARTFRSVQYGAAKGGGLWDVVLRALGLPAGQVLHLGDDVEADVRAPSARGVRTVHLPRVDHGYREILDRERESLDSFGRYGPLLDPEHGDHGLTTLRAKVLAGCPEQGARATAWRYGAGVLGPVLTGFAEWAVRRAAESGAAVVWCPMREGEQLAAMLSAAAAAHGTDVEARPVWLSRQSTSLASLDPADPDALREFLHRGYDVRVRDVLAVLGLRPGEVPGLAEHLDLALGCDDAVGAVADELTGTPHLRRRLVEAAAGARSRLVASLRRSGALAGGPLVLADLGWGGTIQLQLARALEIHGIPVRPVGLYLATDERSVRLASHGLRAEGFLGQAGHPRELVDLLSRSPEVLEQCVSITCGSLLDYTAAGDPVLGDPAGEPAQHAEREAARRGTSAFQQRWNEEVAAAGGAWGDLACTARTRLATIVGSALAAPTPDEAAVFGRWRHEDNLGSRLVTSVLPADLVPAVPYLSPNDLADLHMRDAFWPALLGASDPSLAAAVRALGQGGIRPEAFESPEQASATSIRLRAGDGTWTDGPTTRVRVNPSGLSFARLRAAAPGTAEIALAVPGRPAVVRVDWVEVVATRSGGGRVVLRWESPGDLAGLAMSRCAWLGSTLIEFRAADSALILPVAALAGEPVTSVQVSVAFAMLPRSRSGRSAPLPAANPAARLAGRLGAEVRSGGTAGALRGAVRAGARLLRGGAA